MVAMALIWQLSLTALSRLLTRKLVVFQSIHETLPFLRRVFQLAEKFRAFITRLSKSISCVSVDIPHLLHTNLSGNCSKGLPELGPCVLSFDRWLFMEDEYIIHIWQWSVWAQRITLRVMLHGISRFRLNSILNLSECHFWVSLISEIHNYNKIPLVYI